MIFNGLYEASQNKLVRNLSQRYPFKSQRTKEVMLLVDRADFTNEHPYADFPQQIGFGATISAPHMHALAIDLLEPVINEDSHILDVGSGSGYLAVCFAKMVGSNGTVYGIDHIEDLVNCSKQNIRKNNADLLDSKKLILILGDGRLGYPQGAPYDAIHVGAAPEEIPKALIDQLAIGGRMVIPVGLAGEQQFLQVDKISEKEVRKQVITAVNYVPLTDREQQLQL
ncbi:protein-L-isoaspartate O-methyltransferase [Candidatus Cardinium hertigii]|jgi:protein-L-isoaspartate(D-aspartate) O-methyltransferase|nr:protein-L-isoaspartate O-methyltransferase [Candidatus Cardinium hertigii]